ncbi:unnamed protein product [Rhizophagus irregularis]|nr:unnamed protein product [Rhizophagus irregularis]
MNIPPPNETESPNNAPLLNDDETDSKTAKKLTGKIYLKSSGSTGNAINHLRNKHDITKDGKNNKVC